MMVLADAGKVKTFPKTFSDTVGCDGSKSSLIRMSTPFAFGTSNGEFDDLGEFVH